MSSFVSWWLYKSVIAIFDSIIINMINDYEYYSIVSIHLSHRVHQDKNKDCDSLKTIQEPATEARRSTDLNHFLGLCSVSETWVAAYVLWVLRGGFLITIYTLVNWKLDFLKRKGNYASKSTLAFLCMNVCVYVWAHVASSLNLNEKNVCVIIQYTTSNWCVKELSSSRSLLFCVNLKILKTQEK